MGDLVSVDIVILAQSPAERASNAELFRSLARHWRKIAATASQPDSIKTGNQANRGLNLDG